MPQVTIRPGESDEVVVPGTVGWERTMEIGKMRGARIHVDRSHLDGVTVNKKEDAVELGNRDTLLLVDVEKGGPTWTLVCYSHEWAANNVEPTTGGDLREGDDQTLITGLVGEVPAWSAGSISSFTGPLSFVFSHAHRHEALRRIERNVPGEIQFRDSGTVDYVDSLGSDKSGSVELSADAGTIENSIQITERGRKLDGTHFRVLGAHEGEAQIYSNLVPSDDPATYENRVNYTTSRWSAGDDADWDRWVNSDITDQATSDAEAAALGEEISKELVEVKTTTNLSLDVGDWVQVVKPDSDLDRKMRVHRIREVSESGTVLQELELSTRTVVREDANDTGRRLREFSTGFQGSSVAIAFGPLSKAVDSGNDLELPVRYPDLEFENKAELHVKGSSYRIDSKGVASGGGMTETTDGGGDHTHSVTISSHSHSFDYQALPQHDHHMNPQNWETTSIISGKGDHYHEIDTTNSPTYTANAGTTNTTQETTDSGGGTTETSDASGTHSHSISLPDHTHPIEPGIFTSSDTPSGVDVSIGGTTVESNIGGGSFEAVVDLSGELTKDAWNTIVVSSDSLGILEATLYVEGYDQIGKST